jgi:hypothetical protein
LLAIQSHYIAKYEKKIGEKYAAEADRIERTIYDTVSDDVLANALVLDWLLQQAGVAKIATDAITNNSVRWYYITKLQEDPLPSEIDGYWTKGIGIDQVKALQGEGLDLFEEVYSAKSDDVDACIAAGVPVPDKLFDGAWQDFGTLNEIVGGPDPHNELWLYLDDDPQGFCLSLVRSNGPTDETGHIDLICMGQESSNACFFEAVGYDTDIEGTVDISELYFGENIPTDDGVAAVPCTQCHLGENPFLIHPLDPAFSGALQAKAMQPGSTDTWSANDYYQAFAVPNWPPNPPPLNLAMVPSIERCSDCHVQTFAGRFPHVSQMPDPTLYDYYCSLVVRGVLQGAPGFSPTMPLFDLSNTADYAAHKNYLLAMCNKPDEGEIVDNPYDDDPDVLGPPHVVTPLYGCAEAVYVDGFVEDAEVELLINDVSAGVINPAQGPNPIMFVGFSPLVIGDKVQTRQQENGTWSELSDPVIVTDYRDDYPDGLPAPAINPSTVYACSSVIAVLYDIGGFQVEVLVNGGNPVKNITFPGYLPVEPGKTPFDIDDEFTAQVSACGDVSPVSDPVRAQRLSSDVLTLAEINPTSLYETQRFLNVTNLTYGTNSEILESGAGSLGTFRSPLSWWISGLSTPLALSDQLVVSQNLCDFSSQPSFAQAPPVLSCAALPAPVIKDPLPGENYVTVLQPLLGARFRIYDDNGNELGDRTGSVIPLNRALLAGEFVTAVQQIGNCISSQGFKIKV